VAQGGGENPLLPFFFMVPQLAAILLLDLGACLGEYLIERGRVEQPAGVMFNDEPPRLGGVVMRPHRFDESHLARAFRFLEQHDVWHERERRERDPHLVGALEEEARDALAPCNGPQL
jgi:hypothetical protein